jgi:hypothetical protein
MKNRNRNKPRREDRQVQAKVRQLAYDMLTVAEKLARLGDTGSAKQRARLSAPRSVAAEIIEGVAALAEQPPKEKKGVKAKRQARKDKRGA